jgi:P2 family phage contractile tail tube protein
MAVNINRLTNANVYNNGNSLLGKVDEFTLPTIKGLFTDVKALGMLMAIELPTGFDKMTGTAKWNAVYPELITQFGSPYTTSQIQVRGNLETYDSSGRIAEVPVVAFLTIRFKDILPGLGLKQHENPEQTSEYSCTYYRLEIDGNSMIEIDGFANTFSVNDEDQLVQYRESLGF